MIDRQAVLIAGPTASGKSAAGLRLARGLDGVIVNADSMQVFAQLRILTARPDAEDETSVPHRLYGHVSAREAYSVAAWLEDVRGVLGEIDAAGKRAIFVGGTGLYFNALTRGLAAMPDIDPVIRAHWRAAARARRPQDLHRELMALDPVTGGRLRETDPQRIVRALEVIQSTGRPLAEWQAMPAKPLLPPGTWRGLVIAPSRAILHERANRRFDQMMGEGVLDEVQALRAMQLDDVLPVMRAIGVRPLLAHLDGQVSIEEAVEQSKAQTRQYIKRQTTWLRRNMVSWKWLFSGEN
ncbi:MAG: tRNA (adenosine(37)-N6)-dimethylallyltransferase MiaA [Alphaproteobacteria bacterium]|nr:tRNA (adenosine(37)-N6)-dimethylallyltransferase MiaA [Alphaproteobacteria bacterium]